MSKNKAYVVFSGRQTGVFHSWGECEKQVSGYSGAKYQGYPTLELAHEAFGTPIQKEADKSNSAASKRPLGNYLTVDAAFSHKTKVMEFRGVLVQGKQEKEVFRSPAYSNGGSANVGEFLAIIQGVRYLEVAGLSIPIYSDSSNAQAWIRRKSHNVGVEVSNEVSALLHDANQFLLSGLYRKSKMPIKDWNTREWGEIPADFGRK